MITSIVFSKDRPLQLDLTLKSIKKNMPIVEHVTVIYTTSNHEDFILAYQKLISEHPGVKFVKQGDDIYKDILNNLRYKYTIFFTDDDIVYRPCISTTKEVDEIMDIKEVFCISFRMGLNTTKRDFGDGTLKDDIVPGVYVSEDKNHIFWNRTSVPVGGYWSYPLSVDGHLFLTSDLRYMTHSINNFLVQAPTPETPNQFECFLQRFFFEYPAFMCAEKISCVVNSPNNRVQSDFANRFGDNFNYSPEYLNQLYLMGKRLNLEKFKELEIHSPHTELDLLNAIE
jgi:hypothetical protein